MLRSLIPSRASTLSLLALAASAGAALAQPAALVARATPQVLAPGQSAHVDVLARKPGGAYAVASSQFDVHATSPGWVGASSGFIAGGHILGASFSQTHQPPVGPLADPADPLRIWSGVYQPAVAGPALVEIRPGARTFSIYPSRLTSSSVPLEAAGLVIRPQLVFVNPAPVGDWLAAPGDRTEVRVHDDVIVEGTIITGENPTSIAIGMLVPAVQRTRLTSTRVAFDTPPERFAVESHRQQGPIPTDQFSVNFTKITFSRGYEVRAEFPDPGPITFTAFNGGVSVGAGDADHGEPVFKVSTLPDVVRSSGGPHVRVFDGVSRDASCRWIFTFDRPVDLQLSDGRMLKADTVEVRGAGSKVPHNLKQLGLAAHVFESSGAGLMRLTPVQP